MSDRSVPLITNSARFTDATAVGRKVASIAFIDDGAIQAIGVDGVVRTITTTDTTAPTTLTVTDTTSGGVTTVLALVHGLETDNAVAGIGTRLDYYASCTGGPVNIGQLTFLTTDVGAGTVTSEFRVRTRINGTSSDRLTIDAAGDVVSSGRLALRNGTAYKVTLTGTPTADRVLTLPNTTDTLVVSNDPRLLANGEMGRVCLVDQTLGSDATGARSGLPFATITAALAAAQAGDCVWIMPGTYSESLTLPTNVSVRGISERAVTIQRLLVTADVDLVTMGEGSTLEEVTLRLTSAEHHTLRGVVWPGTTSATAIWHDSTLYVENATAPLGGTSNVYGCVVVGTGIATDESVAIRAVEIHVHSAGGGTKRAILVSGAATAHVHDFVLHVTSAGGAGSYIGAETTDATAILRLNFGSSDGATADISRTAGTIDLGSVSLINANANGLGFTATLAAGLIPMVYADAGSTPSGTRYMRPGTATVASAEQFLRIPGKTMIRSISARAATGPGADRTDTWTVRINGVDTPVAVSLVGAAVAAVTNTTSAGSTAAFDMSVRQVCAASSATSDVAIVVSLY